MFTYKKLKSSDRGIIAFEAHKHYNVTSATTSSFGVSFDNTKYSSESLDTYSAGGNDLFNSKRYRQIDHLFYNKGNRNYGNLLGGFEYTEQEKRLYDIANILGISQDNTGNGIQKGTFNLNNTYKDDSKGNIYNGSTDTLLNGLFVDYPLDTDRVFYLAPTKGFKKVDLTRETITGRPIVNHSSTHNAVEYDDSLFNNSVKYVSCSFKYMDGDLDGYTGVNLDQGYIEIPHNNTFNYNDEDFTISFWYNPKDLSGVKYLISKGFTKTDASSPTTPPLSDNSGSFGPQDIDAGNSYPFAIYADGSNLYLERSDENSTCRVQAPLFGTGLVNYIFVKDGNTLRSYANGITVTSNDVVDTTTNCGNQGNLYIGNKGGSRSTEAFGIEPAGGEISQIMIFSKALSQNEINKVKSSITGTPVVGNIFYENGIATITKPNIAANTLISSETATVTLTLAQTPNNVDPEFISATIPGPVYSGSATFFTSSVILDIDDKTSYTNVLNANRNATTQVVEGSSDVVFLAPRPAIDFGGFLINPIVRTEFLFNFINLNPLTDSVPATRFAEKLEGVSFFTPDNEDKPYSASLEVIRLGAGFETNDEYSEGFWTAILPPVFTLTSSFSLAQTRESTPTWMSIIPTDYQPYFTASVYNASLGTNVPNLVENTINFRPFQNRWTSNNNVASLNPDTSLSHGFNQFKGSPVDNFLDQGGGPFTAELQSDLFTYLDDEGDEITSTSGAQPQSFPLSPAISLEAKAYNNNSNKALLNLLVCTGSRGNITAFEGATLKHESGSGGNPAGNLSNEDLFLDSDNGRYASTAFLGGGGPDIFSVPFAYPGGINGGNIYPALTASTQQVDGNSTLDSRVEPGVIEPDTIPTADGRYMGFNFHKKRLFGEYENNVLYGSITRLQLQCNLRFKVYEPDSDPTKYGDQNIQFKFAYYHKSTNTHYDIFDEDGDKLETDPSLLSQGVGFNAKSITKTINPLAMDLKVATDMFEGLEGTPADFTAFEDEEDQIRVLVRSIADDSEKESGVIIGSGTGISYNGFKITDQNPEFGPSDYLGFSSDMITPIKSGTPKRFTINGISSKISDINGAVDYHGGTVDNVHMRTSLNKTIGKAEHETNLGIRVDLYEMDLNPDDLYDMQMPRVLEGTSGFYNRAHLLTSSLFEAGTTVNNTTSDISTLDFIGAYSPSNLSRYNNWIEDPHIFPRDLDFEHFLTASEERNMFLAYRIGVVDFNNAYPDENNLLDFRLAPTNGAEGFAVGCIHLAEIKPTNTQSFYYPDMDGFPLNNNQLLSPESATGSVLTSIIGNIVDGGTTAGDIITTADLNDKFIGELPTQITSMSIKEVSGQSYFLGYINNYTIAGDETRNLLASNIILDNEFAILPDREFEGADHTFEITGSFTQGSHTKASASFEISQSGLYEARLLDLGLYHNRNNVYANPIYGLGPEVHENNKVKVEFYYKEPGLAPGASGVLLENVTKTVEFPNGVNSTARPFNSISNIGYQGFMAEGATMSIQLTLLDEDDVETTSFPHQGIISRNFQNVRLTSSREVTRVDGGSCTGTDPFTEQQIEGSAIRFRSPHVNSGISEFPFDGPGAIERITASIANYDGPNKIILKDDFFITMSGFEANPFIGQGGAVKTEIPFNYAQNRLYHFNFNGGTLDSWYALVNSEGGIGPGDTEMDSILSGIPGFNGGGLGVRVIDSNGIIKAQKYSDSDPVNYWPNSFSTTFGNTGTGKIQIFSSGAISSLFSDGNVTASYIGEGPISNEDNIPWAYQLGNIDISITESKGSDTTNESFARLPNAPSGEPLTISITSSHVNSGDQGFFTMGKSLQNILEIIPQGDSTFKIRIGNELFITASSPATASIDQIEGFDYVGESTANAVTINSISPAGTAIGDNIVGSTFTFTDQAGATTLYTIQQVIGGVGADEAGSPGSLVLSSQTVPATGQDDQILITPSFEDITINYLTPADNSDFNLQFKNTHLIFENEFHCTVEENEFNFTLNPTARKNKDITKGDLANFATSSIFKPYVTTIGLYNEDNELLVIGKLAQPIKISEEIDTTFVVRYDT